MVYYDVGMVVSTSAVVTTSATNQFTAAIVKRTVYGANVVIPVTISQSGGPVTVSAVNWTGSIP